MVKPSLTTFNINEKLNVDKEGLTIRGIKDKTVVEQVSLKTSGNDTTSAIIFDVTAGFVTLKDMMVVDVDVDLPQYVIRARKGVESCVFEGLFFILKATKTDLGYISLETEGARIINCRVYNYGTVNQKKTISINGSLYVRGGGPDQNLILLDGIPVYNADHLLGVFSVFTPEAIKNTTLYKSSFPARYGGRLSSIVDIRTNDGDMHHYHGALSVGTLTDKLHFEGPIWKGHTSFSLSARATHTAFFKNLIVDKDDYYADKYNYYFYDINAKVNHKFNDRSRLFIGFYKGKDHYHFDTTDSNNYYQNNDDTKVYYTSTRIRWSAASSSRTEKSSVKAGTSTSAACMPSAMHSRTAPRTARAQTFTSRSSRAATGDARRRAQTQSSSTRSAACSSAASTRTRW